MLQVSNGEKQTDKNRNGQETSVYRVRAPLVEPTRSAYGNQGLLRMGRDAEIAPVTPLRPSQTAVALLQRKCACGNTKAAGSECKACKAKKRMLLQTKLTIGEPGDSYEQEADRVADQVMAAPAHTSVSKASSGVQRHAATSDGGVDYAPASVDRALASHGMPMDSLLRQDMEHRFGYDFSQVRVHSNADATQSTQDMNALAFTVGRDIVFAEGRFAPGTHEGRRLIAHELTHVVQQGSNTSLLQRQEIEDLPIPPRSQPSLPEPDVNIDPTALSEPHCPRPPTRLGNLTPTPLCKEDGEDIDGDVFSFCEDSDVFSDPADLRSLRTFVSGQPSGTSFSLRAYTSIEGPGSAQNANQYNRNLSCHRLNRMIREILNLGVQEQQIDAVSKGPTERFGTGASARSLNRVAIIVANPPQQQGARADATGMTMAQIRDAAKQRIANGDYPLAADAYFLRWSCGRWRTLAEAVDRTTVLIEGLETDIQATDELGTTSGIGANTIVISRDIANATDPIGCAANRIVDLTFHHFSRRVLSNFEDQHRAGMHLVHLAGLSECRIPLDPLNVNFNVRSRPNPVGPFIGFVPRCADQPLPGPLPNQLGPTTMETPPTFVAAPLTLAGANGSVIPSPSSSPITVGVEPDSPFMVQASVNAVGTPASIANFEIGFVQTVMEENWINTHVDGRRERRRFPLPLRDGPPRSHPLSEPPWFDKNSKLTASSGTNAVTLTDAPNFRAFRFLPDIPSSVFVESAQVPRPGGGRDVTLERPTFVPRLGPLLPANTPSGQIQEEQRRQDMLRNNVPDRGRRVLNFNTWVVARRKNPPAPETLGATQFLSGLRLTFNLTANWSPPASGGIMGSGSYIVTSSPATSGDAEAMMLRGATPLDFIGPTNGIPLFAEFLDIDDPLPRAQAGGLPRDAYFDAVRQIAGLHRTGPVMRGEVAVRVNVEVATGRVVLDTPDLQRGAIRVLNAGLDLINNPETQAFARAVFPEVRKLVLAPGLAPNEPQTGIMPVAIRLPRLGSP